MTEATAASFYNKMERPWLSRLDRAAIVGHTTPTTSKVWVRMKAEGQYRFVLSRSPLRGASGGPTLVSNRWSIASVNDDNLIVQDAAVTGRTDFIFVVKLSGLQPDTRYYYGVFCVDTGVWHLGFENDYHFSTQPEVQNGRADCTFAYYSCHMPFDPHSRSKADASLWSFLLAELEHADARFVIGGGDQAYADGVDHLNIWSWLKRVKNQNPTREDMRSWYRDIYRGYWNFPDLKMVLQRFPNYMIWDDHEIMDGWGSYTRKELSQRLDTLFEFEDANRNVRWAKAMFAAATDVYVEYQHSHNPDTVDQVFDYSFEQSGADFYVMDMRGHRDYEKKSILGAPQRTRIEQWTDSLATSSQRPAPIFVVSTVPVVHLKDFVSDLLDWASVFGGRDDVRDHWAHDSHMEEVRWLLQTMFECSDRTERPLVFLSGDVHIGTVFKLWHKERDFPSARVFQVTSSPITYAAIGQSKMKLLAKAVAKTGEIGVPTSQRGSASGSGYCFENSLLFPQHNFGLIRFITDGTKTTHIEVDLIGQSDDGRVKESTRVNLLDL